MQCSCTYSCTWLYTCFLPRFVRPKVLRTLRFYMTQDTMQDTTPSMHICTQDVAGRLALDVHLRGFDSMALTYP